jgi:hypothetical protein
LVSGIELSGNAGANSQYVVVDSTYLIIGLPNDPEDFDFSGEIPGTYFIVHISYDGPLTGLDLGNNLLSDLEGCYSLSNSIEVIALDCEGLQGGDPVFEMKITPNPVTDVMTLKMLYNGDMLPFVQVIDASGRICFEQEHDMHSDMKINMGHLSEGLYFVRIQTAYGTRIASIVVIK